MLPNPWVLLTPLVIRFLRSIQDSGQLSLSTSPVLHPFASTYHTLLVFLFSLLLVFLSSLPQSPLLVPLSLCNQLLRGFVSDLNPLFLYPHILLWPCFPILVTVSCLSLAYSLSWTLTHILWSTWHLHSDISQVLPTECPITKLLVLFFPLPPIPCPLPILLFLQVSQSGKRDLCPPRSLTLLSSSLHIQLILKTFLSYFNFSASPLTVISSDLQSIFFSPISTCFPSGHSFHSSQSDFV